MHPEQNNVGHIHTHCADTRRAKWQKENAGLKLHINDLVKLGFPYIDSDEKECKEHMWVRITEIDESNFKGTLENTPFFIEAEHGCFVNFTFDEIEEHARI
jgi:uncharacterized protein YegJ (DUF2314 family)